MPAIQSTTIDGIIIIAFGLAVFFITAWVVWVDARRRHNSLKTQNDFRQQVLAKFSTSEEFTAFLRTPEGKAFIMAPTHALSGPLASVIRSVQVGIVLLVVGLICVPLSLALIGYNISELVQAIVTGASILALAVGIGLLIASLVSYRLARRLGLLKQAGEANQQSS